MYITLSLLIKFHNKFSTFKKFQIRTSHSVVLNGQTNFLVRKYLDGSSRYCSAQFTKCLGKFLVKGYDTLNFQILQ